MKKSTQGDATASSSRFEALEVLAREQIQQWLQRMLEEELTAFLGRPKSERRTQVDAKPGYRNGHGKERRLATSMGTVRVRRPRVRGSEEPFESKVLPLFVRRTKQVGALLPTLYLHGLALGDFELALRGLLGEGAPLSKTSLERLKAGWQQEHAAWSRRSLVGKEVAYVWADGVYVKAGLEKEKAAVLVLMGALRDGTKEVLALVSGHRESEESWAEALRDLKKRGLEEPRLVVADGHLGIWGAVARVWPQAEHQRCFNHKLRNVLDKLPKKELEAARALLKPIPYAATRAEAEALRDAFVAEYQPKAPKATACLLDDWERLVTYYRFPKEHWKHLRTTNIIESPFASLRLRTDAAKRFRKVENATVLLWKLLLVAQKSFRKLDAAEHLRDVLAGRTYEDGNLVMLPQGTRRAA
ncbi:IS256 family transposase [Corallococcus sp. AS-1-12]|uniref:IS256 family transposase n=1 Tax=Corallococcus sp. AS-1-12 TaxID=2874598 RepID=UPI001CBBDAB4|nr:IS256 family transposase [Corallococcus sp. AS-1-12]MBZ4336749.1 IS256 family transposase [Corallococcus sp. AS-1-12]